MRREVPGHVANRLQAALWREALHLIGEGVASVQDVDLAVSAGPGLRWATMGPTQLFHLGGDDGGIAAFCDRYADSFHRWWDDLGTARLDPATVAQLIDGMAEIDHAATASGKPGLAGQPEQAGAARADQLARRDALLLAVLNARRRTVGQIRPDTGDGEHTERASE